MLIVLIGLPLLFVLPSVSAAQTATESRAALPGNWVISGVGRGKILPLFAQPGNILDVTGTVKDGDPVLNLGCVRLLGTRWCNVEKTKGDRARGYLLDRHLTEAPGTPSTPDDDLAGGPDFWVVAGLPGGDRLNIRSEPSGTARVLATLSEGERVRNLGCRMAGTQRWCRIRSTEGVDVTGWVNGRYLREAGGAPPPPGGGGSAGKDRREVFGLRADDVLNIRTEPSTSGRILIGLKNGTIVRSLGCQQFGAAQWCRIRFEGKGIEVIGWANGRYLRDVGGGTRPPSGGQANTLTVTGLSAAQRLNIRQSPSATSRALGTLGLGDRVRNLGCTDTPGWCLVRTTQGSDVTGYVASRYLTP